MISCQQVLNQLWEYLDGELPPGEVAEIREHLDACAPCAPYHRARRRFLEVVRKSDGAVVPERLRQRVHENLLRERTRAGSRVGPGIADEPR